jgi:Leucine-rich repeat (LRR) protein
MSSLDLQSRFCDFSAFDNLEELNLSHNKIADPTEMGLAAAASTLRVLDLSHNQIAIPHPKIAAFLDSLTALECVALHHNPCMRSDADRKAITRNMKSLRQVPNLE